MSITNEQARNLARIFYAANQRHAHEIAEQEAKQQADASNKAKGGSAA